MASAKNPKRWPNLFQFRAAYVEPPQMGTDIPPVRITLPNGDSITSDDAHVNEVLSDAVRRSVILKRAIAKVPHTLEEYWPKLEELPHQDAVTDEPVHEGTFFDAAVIHLLSTATINRLRQFYPEGNFDIRRFRPNIFVQLAEDNSGFVEDEWHGGRVSFGSVTIQVSGPCPRCVMTTLAQDDLPQDLGILKTAARQNKAQVGIYASVARAGRVAVGDVVSVEAVPAAVA